MTRPSTSASIPVVVLLTALLCSLAVTATHVAAQTPDFYDDTVVRRVDLTFHDKDYWSKLTANWSTKTYMKCDLKVDGVTFKDVGARFRGNSWSWGLPTNSQKRAFKISLDEYVPDRKLQSYKTLNFNNNFYDPSWMRETVAYGVFRKFMPAPKCNYVHLYINGQSWGPYFNTQQINKAMLAEWFADNDGNRYRGERKNLLANADKTALTWLGNSATSYQPYYELKLKNAPAPWTDLIQVCNVLNNTASTQLYTELPKVLDVDSALWMHANATVLIWLDSYIGRYSHNFYVNSDKANGRMVFTPWDTNGCFGGYTDGNSSVHKLSPFYNENHAARPAFTKLVKNPRWRQRYLAHVRTILDTEFDWARLESRIKRYQKLIGPLVKNDTKGLYTYQNFLDNWRISARIYVLGTWRTVPGLKDFNGLRAAALRAHAEVRRVAPKVSNLARSVPAPSPQDDVWITAKVSSTVAVGGAALYYRVRGPYVETPMFDDGKHGDGKAGDGVWGAAIPKQPGGKRVQYYVSARSTSRDASAMTFLPRTASNRPPSYVVAWPRTTGPVLINELMAKNVSVIRDEKGEFEDWIELTNTSSAAVSVGGMYLSDDYDDATKWKIPAGTTIPAHGKLLVWCDSEPSDGPLHANFKLSVAGEWIGLFDTTGTKLSDDIQFGPQIRDVSCGRLYDDKLPWVSIGTPTPTTSNVMACGSRLFSAFNPFAHRFRATLVGQPKIGTTPSFVIANGPKSGSVALYLALAGGHIEVTEDFVVLLDGPAVVGPIPIRTDAAGAATLKLPIANLPSIVGLPVVLQVGGKDATGFTASNAVHLILCK